MGSSFDRRGFLEIPPSARREVELTMQEHSGTEGFQQLLRPSSVAE